MSNHEQNLDGDSHLDSRERLENVLNSLLGRELEGSTASAGHNSISATLTSGDLQRLLALFTARGTTTRDTTRAANTITIGSANVNVEEDDDDPDYVDEEEEEDDEDYSFYTFGHSRSRPWDRTKWWPKVTEPQEEGLELLYGGEFGRIRHQSDTRSGKCNVASKLLNRGSSSRPTCREDLATDVIPNSNGTAVASYVANAYVGQFSSDSAFYYTCVRNFRLHVYDTAAPFKLRSPHVYSDGHRTTMQVIKTIQAIPGRWTITDSHLSPDNQRMIYASVSSIVHMTSTLDSSTEQIPINFGDSGSRGRRPWADDDDEEQYGIWSCKFSADGNEVIAGGSSMIFVYDLIADRRTVKILGHSNDVNTCCWADTASGNVLISGSDDSFVKVWDRRSLAGTRKPSGVLIGHTEGITYVSAKGDGRYVISNGKDQILRLWDLRMMRSNSDFEAVKDNFYGIPQFDYRGMNYPNPRVNAHPLDCSVMKYTGHEVLRTLIRCHFSPAETTGQQYIYSGSADGRIHIWSLDGRVVQVLDRSYTIQMPSDPTGPEPAEMTAARVRPCVRDVSWHSQQPVLMSTGWLGRHWGNTEGSAVARHEWKGLSQTRGGLEDWVEKQKQERNERAGRRAQRSGMPGSFDPSSPLSGEASSEDDD